VVVSATSSEWGTRPNGRKSVDTGNGNSRKTAGGNTEQRGWGGLGMEKKVVERREGAERQREREGERPAPAEPRRRQSLYHCECRLPDMSGATWRGCARAGSARECQSRASCLEPAPSTGIGGWRRESLPPRTVTPAPCCSVSQRKSCPTCETSRRKYDWAAGPPVTRMSIPSCTSRMLRKASS